MPKITIRLDGDKILQDIIKDPWSEMAQRPFANGLLEDVSRDAVLKVAGEIFDTVFKTIREILISETGFLWEEFELQASLIGRFDQNYLPLNTEVTANDRPVWYEEGAQKSEDLDIQLAKQRRIAELAVAVMQDYLESKHAVRWSANFWSHVGKGYYHEVLVD